MWAREWERIVARPWVFGTRSVAFALASNENVEPASETARGLWTREYNRRALMRNWSRRVDMAYAPHSGRASIDVCVSASFLDVDGFVFVDVTFERLECSLDEAACHASVRVDDARRDGMSFASLSRNPNTRPCDVLSAPNEAWDASELVCATARPPELAPIACPIATSGALTEAAWEIDLRYTLTPADAIRNAEECGVRSEIIVLGAGSNAHLRLREAARLGVLIAGRSWLAATLVSNPMRSARADAERTSRLACILVRALRLPWHIAPVVARWAMLA